MARIRGLELIFCLVQKQIKSKEDCAVAAIHCLFINEGLHCVATGEDSTFSNLDTKTELLPNHWNDNQEVYVLLYISKDLEKQYLVKAVKAGHMLHINAILNENKTAHLSIDVNNFVNDDYTEYANTFYDLNILSESFKSEIWEKLHSKSSSDKAHPKVKPVTTPIATNPFPNPPVRPSPFIDREIVHPPPFPNVGHRDLDPFGSGLGGGMLMDPSSFFPSSGRPQLPSFGGIGIPRGSIPPGARFDPFGPPMRGPNRGNPDPDHIRRDGFTDQDFM